MRFPEDFLEELRARNDITDVISSYIQLKRAGKNTKGLCPFHGEKTPSFTVYPDSSSYYCFGCGAGGDIVTFIRTIENLSYPEAVKLLAERAGIAVPEDDYSQRDTSGELKTRILEANRTAAKLFHAILYSETGKQGLEYLRNKRGLDGATIKKFGLGFAPDSWDTLKKHMNNKGFKDEELIMADLLVRGKQNGGYDRFRNRVMFPIINVRGNVVGFGGRVMDDSKPKYLNTSDTLIFKKSANLFSLNNAKNSKKGRIILAEGYMDVIALFRAGFTEAVATLGTALTSEQARLISGCTDTVYICYDSDEAGQKATGRAIDILKPTGTGAKIITVTDGKDPDEFLRKHGAGKFEMLLDGAGNDVEYLLLKAKNAVDSSTDAGRVAYINEAVKILAKLGTIEQDIYAGRLAKEAEIEKSSILSRVKSVARRLNKDKEKREFSEIQKEMAGFGDSINPGRSKHLKIARAEEGLIALLLSNPEYQNHISGKISADDFMTDFNKKVFLSVTDRLENGKAADISAIAGDFSVEEAGRISGMLAKTNGLPHSAQEADDYIKVIKKECETDRLKSGKDVNLEDFFRKLAEQKGGGKSTEFERDEL